MGPEMEEDSLNTASTFVKCALGRPPLRPVRAGRLSRVRNYSQFRVNESKTIRIAVQTRVRERERKRRGNAESGVKCERAGNTRREWKSERAREIKTDPLSSATPADVPFPLPPLPAPSPLPPPDKSDPGGTPGLTPRLAGEIFKFCHVQV